MVSALAFFGRHEIDFNPVSSKTQTVLLWLCTFLFMGRVMGQILVGIYHPPLLPAWSEWYSGLLPYPWLLLTQLLLLMFMAIANTDTARGAGRFFVTSEKARHRLLLFSQLYAGAMVVRYLVRMTLQPDSRWLGGTIPIWFHFVLAFWIYLLSVKSRSNA